jgi:hypothetical protein
MLTVAAAAWQCLADGAGPAFGAPRPENATNLAPSLLQQFKDFISHPPVIKSLVFAKKIPMNGGALPLDGSFARSTRFDYFQAKWQTNGILFRELTTPSDVTNDTVAGELVAWSGHHHALVEPNGNLTTWDDRDPSVAGKNVSVFYTARFLLRPLQEVMNLGVMYGGTGQISWEGDRFRLAREVNHQRLVMTGKLFEDRGGRPRAMRVRYAFPHQTNDYIVRYGYTPALHYAFVPTVMTNFWMRDGAGSGGGMELDQWRILDLRIAPRPMRLRQFASARFEEAHAWQRRIYTNGAIYEVRANGALHLVYNLPAPGAPPIPRLRKMPPAFYAGWAAVNVTIFALMVGARERKEQNNEKPKTTV